MADTLKSRFGPAVPREIARNITSVYRDFPSEDFLRDVLAGYGPLSLTGRGFHIAAALRKYLPQDYPRAVGLLVKSARENDLPFFLMPHLAFVAKYGLDHFEESMRAQHALTQLFTAEFSIRAFLEKHPQKTLARLREWATDPSPHVRRLVSEGTRPRLPWAQRLRAFQNDPRPVIELLELLKDDPEIYVRRSVANNLNDIGKDHPELVATLARRWLRDATPERQWIVRHALRSAVKRAEAGALKVLGYGGKVDVSVGGFSATPRSPKIGGSVVVRFDVTSKSARRQRVMVDLVVHFVKSRGTGAKTFKLKAVDLAPRAKMTFSKKIALTQLTTRKHYAGVHRLEVLLNGERRKLGTFLICR